MFALKRLYDAVTPTDYCSVDDTVPVHLFTAMENVEGSVLCNLEAKLVVLNLTGGSYLEQALELASWALAEMSALETGTLVYDLRHSPDAAGSPSDFVARVRLVESGALNCLAMLTAPGSAYQAPVSYQDMLNAAQVEVLHAHKFGHLINVLKRYSPVLAAACDAVRPVADFSANYGGSAFSVPELQATVIRTSGNHRHSAYFDNVFYSALALHVRNKASTMILDTSDSPEIEDESERQRFNDTIVNALAALGISSTLVRVQAKDASPEGLGKPFSETCEGWEVFGCEAETLAEAFSLVRVLKGCCTAVVPTFPRAVFAQS
jgi:hypothetical protein